MRMIMFLAAVNNILVELKWLYSKANSLVDTFSWLNRKYISNICPS